MMRLFNALGVFAVATLLAVGGFVGFLFGTGRLSAARVELLAAVLRGELDGVAGGAPAAASQPADATSPPVEGSLPRFVEERLATDLKNLSPEARRRRVELERLRLERAAADMEARRSLLEQTLQHVIAEQERLEAEKAALLALQERQRTETAAREDGFKKELEYVSNLKPAQAKEYLIRVWQRQKADAARLLSEIEESRGRRILEQFKTPEELQIMTDLLERIRLQGTEGHANASRMTEGAAVP
jgi:hypothetical protein